MKTLWALGFTMLGGFAAHASTMIAEVQAKHAKVTIDGQAADAQTNSCFYLAKINDDGERSLLLTNSDGNDVSQVIGQIFFLRGNADLNGDFGTSAKYANGVLTYREAHAGAGVGQNTVTEVTLAVSADLKVITEAHLKIAATERLGKGKHLTTMDCQF